MFLTPLFNRSCLLSSRLSHVSLRSFQTAVPSFPYNLRGGIMHVYDQEAHFKLRSFLQFLDKSLESGFLFAYNSLLDGLLNHDLQFLNQNFENRFFRRIETFPTELDQNELELRLIGDDSNEEVEVIFKEMSLIMGVRLQRDMNPKGLQENNLKPDKMIKFKLYSPNKSFFLGANSFMEIRPLLQIPVVFRSRKKLVLKRKGDEMRSKNERLEEFHHVQFECEGANLVQTSLFGEMVKLVGMGRRQEKDMGEIFNKFFFTKESEWKITDIDDFMEGNDF